MAEEAAAPPSEARQRPAAGRDESWVWGGMVIGVGLACVGVADGVLMAFEKVVAHCPNGTEFPQGATDLNCYSHPHLGAGVAIAVMSALLGLVTVLAAVAAAAAIRPPGSAPTS
jgi:hypothetical protein